jgi:hypothetical protein
MSGFNSKKSAPANVVAEDSNDFDTAELDDIVCRRHKEQSDMICECKFEPICDDCLKDH